MRARGVGRCGKGRESKARETDPSPRILLLGRAAAVHCLSSEPQQNILSREAGRYGAPYPLCNRALTVADESISREYLHLYELAAFSRPGRTCTTTAERPTSLSSGDALTWFKPTLLCLSGLFHRLPRFVSPPHPTSNRLYFLLSRFSLSASGTHSPLIVSIFQPFDAPRGFCASCSACTRAIVHLSLFESLFKSLAWLMLLREVISCE